MKIERKNIVARNQMVSYLIGGDVSRKATLVFLHGWKSEAAIWAGIISDVGGVGYRSIALDFPGFGKSQNPRKPFTVSDYVEVLHELLRKLNVRNPILVGHSFGGRVALKYAYTYPNGVLKIILVGSAGIRLKSTSRTLKKGVAKVVKPLFKPSFMEPLRRGIYRALGAHDYVDREDLKETFLNVIQEDLRSILPRVSATTLLLWGERDKETRPEEGAIMNALLPRSEMIEIKSAGHYAFLDDQQTFSKELLSFIEE